MNKRLIWNFLLLLLGLVLAVSLSALIGFFLSKIPDTHSSDGFLNIGYELYALPIGLLLIIGVIVGWTIRIVGDIRTYKKNKKVVVINSLFLLLVYFPFCAYAIRNSIRKAGLQAEWSNQRNSVTRKVASYKTFAVRQNSWIVGFQNKEDTMCLYVRSFSKTYGGRILILNRGAIAETEMQLNELHIYYLKDNEFTEAKAFRLDTMSFEHWAILNTKLPNEDCRIYHGEENNTLILNKSCLSNVPDTLKGFNVTSGGAGYNYFIDDKNYYWFLFYTTESSKLFIGVSNSAKQKKVYEVTLLENDKENFKGTNTKTIVRQGNTMYIIGKEKILYFDL